jgi:hypothetical protein
MAGSPILQRRGCGGTGLAVVLIISAGSPYLYYSYVTWRASRGVDGLHKKSGEGPVRCEDLSFFCDDVHFSEGGQIRLLGLDYT